MRTVTVKKTCCKDSPRCAKCPVTCMRLERAGYAERQGKRTYAVAKNMPRKVRRAARAR